MSFIKFFDYFLLFYFLFLALYIIAPRRIFFLIIFFGIVFPFFVFHDWRIEASCFLVFSRFVASSFASCWMHLAWAMIIDIRAIRWIPFIMSFFQPLYYHSQLSEFILWKFADPLHNYIQLFLTVRFIFAFVTDDFLWLSFDFFAKRSNRLSYWLFRLVFIRWYFDWLRYFF